MWPDGCHDRAHLCIGSEKFASEYWNIFIVINNYVPYIYLYQSLNHKCHKKWCGVFALAVLVLVGCENKNVGPGTDDDGSKDTVTDVLETMDCDQFRDYCQSYFDTDNDGKVSLEEVAAVTAIDLYRRDDIVSVKGIENFTNLESLDCRMSGITELGLGANTALKTLSCNNSKSLRTADLSGTNITVVTERMFSLCPALESVVLPDKCTTIGASAFKQSGNVSVELSENIESIEELAFYRSGIEEITIPGSASIGEQAFSECASLTKLTVGEGITKISTYTFLGCSMLQEISLPSTMTGVYIYAFTECPAIERVTCAAVTPPTLDDWAFDEINAVLYVPAESMAAYQESPWGTVFSEIRAIE